MARSKKKQKRRVTKKKTRATKGKFRCSACTLKFRSRRGLAVHASRMHGVTKSAKLLSAKLLPHECRWCEKRFDTVRGVRLHEVRKHPKQRKVAGKPRLIRPDTTPEKTGGVVVFLRFPDMENANRFAGQVIRAMTGLDGYDDKLVQYSLRSATGLKEGTLEIDKTESGIDALSS